MVKRIAENAYSAEDRRLHYVTSSLIMYYMTSELVTKNLKWKSELVTRDEFTVWRVHCHPFIWRPYHRHRDVCGCVIIHANAFPAM